MYLTPPTKRNFSFFEGKGYYPCRSCYTCRPTKESKKKKRSFKSTVTSKEYFIEDFISCRTEGVVYPLECPCRIQYIGRTKRELWKRLREHVQNIKNFLLNIAYRDIMQSTTTRIPHLCWYVGLKNINPIGWGDNKIIKLSQSESRWIHELLTLAPLGHNVEFDLKCFIIQFLSLYLLPSLLLIIYLLFTCY